MKKAKLLYQLDFQISPPSEPEGEYPIMPVYTRAYSKNQALAQVCRKHNLDLKSKPWPRLQKVWVYLDGPKSAPDRLY